MINSFSILQLAKHVNDDSFAHKKVLRIKYAKNAFFYIQNCSYITEDTK